jgi:hypothetical protein
MILERNMYDRRVLRMGERGGANGERGGARQDCRLSSPQTFHGEFH